MLPLPYLSTNNLIHSKNNPYMIYLIKQLVLQVQKNWHDLI